MKPVVEKEENPRLVSGAIEVVKRNPKKVAAAVGVIVAVFVLISLLG